MSKEWAHDAVRKEVPTVKTITLGSHAVMTDGGAYLAVAGTCPQGGVAAQLVQDRSGFAPAFSAMRDGVVVVRSRMALKKNPFMTHGAAINGALLGPHRAWDPV